MTKFIANFEFGANLTPEEAQEWIATVREQLPDGASGTVKTVPLMLEVENLTEQHIGEHVKVYVDKHTGEVEGTLDALYVAGRQGIARTLVINGTAYTLTYGIVQLSKW